MKHAPLAIAASATLAAAVLGQSSLVRGKGLTDVEGLRVGHFTLTERPTGCTVVLIDGDGAPGGVSQRGAAPGTRETDLLDPSNLIDKVNAIVLAGGSAFGLDAAQGVVRYLERNIGWRGRRGGRPDRSSGDSDGPRRRRSASAPRPIAVTVPRSPRRRRPLGGNAGARAPATRGVAGRARSMKGGIGSASITLPNGLVVGAS